MPWCERRGKKWNTGMGTGNSRNRSAAVNNVTITQISRVLGWSTPPPLDLVGSRSGEECANDECAANEAEKGTEFTQRHEVRHQVRHRLVLRLDGWGTTVL